MCGGGGDEVSLQTRAELHRMHMQLRQFNKDIWRSSTHMDSVCFVRCKSMVTTDTVKRMCEKCKLQYIHVGCCKTVNGTNRTKKLDWTKKKDTSSNWERICSNVHTYTQVPLLLRQCTSLRPYKFLFWY